MCIPHEKQSFVGKSIFLLCFGHGVLLCSAEVLPPLRVNRPLRLDSQPFVLTLKPFPREMTLANE